MTPRTAATIDLPTPTLWAARERTGGLTVSAGLNHFRVEYHTREADPVPGPPWVCGPHALDAGHAHQTRAEAEACMARSGQPRTLTITTA